MSKSDYLETSILNHVLRGVAFASPAGVYVALYTSPPSDAGGGTEVAGNGYVRQAVTFGAPSGGQVSNSADILFPTATADWGTITSFAIFDAPSAGNMLYYTNLNSPRAVLVNDQLRFPASQIIAQEG
jgi:hypothetical protein